MLDPIENIVDITEYSCDFFTIVDIHRTYDMFGAAEK